MGVGNAGQSLSPGSSTTWLNSCAEATRMPQRTTQPLNSDVVHGNTAATPSVFSWWTFLPIPLLSILNFYILRAALKTLRWIYKSNLRLPIFFYVVSMVIFFFFGTTGLFSIIFIVLFFNIFFLCFSFPFLSHSVLVYFIYLVPCSFLRVWKFGSRL